MDVTPRETSVAATKMDFISIGVRQGATLPVPAVCARRYVFQYLCCFESIVVYSERPLMVPIHRLSEPAAAST